MVHNFELCVLGLFGSFVALAHALLGAFGFCGVAVLLLVKLRFRRPTIQSRNILKFQKNIKNTGHGPTAERPH